MKVKEISSFFENMKENEGKSDFVQVGSGKKCSRRIKKRDTKCNTTEGFGNILDYFQKQNFRKKTNDVPSENLENTAQLGFTKNELGTDALSVSSEKQMEWKPGLN